MAEARRGRPRDAPAFLGALVEKQEGKLAAFYSALWKADEAHRRFFTRHLSAPNGFLRGTVRGRISLWRRAPSGRLAYRVLPGFAPRRKRRRPVSRWEAGLERRRRAGRRDSP